MNTAITQINRDKYGRFVWNLGKKDFRADPRKQKIDFSCKWCKKVLKLLPYQFKDRKFCSFKCYIEDRKVNTPTGENHWSWTGGRYKKNDGYIEININENDKRIKILEHRFVMEQYLGRKLTNNELVHHKNGIKDDNRLSNLEIVIKKLHFGNVRCPHCLKKFKIK